MRERDRGADDDGPRGAHAGQADIRRVPEAAAGARLQRHQHRAAVDVLRLHRPRPGPGAALSRRECDFRPVLSRLDGAVWGRERDGPGLRHLARERARTEAGPADEIHTAPAAVYFTAKALSALAIALISIVALSIFASI